MSKTRVNRPLNWQQSLPTDPEFKKIIKTRQLTRQYNRIVALQDINNRFPGESRRVRRILALDSLRKHKKGLYGGLGR